MKNKNLTIYMFLLLGLGLSACQNPTTGLTTKPSTVSSKASSAEKIDKNISKTDDDVVIIVENPLDNGSNRNPTAPGFYNGEYLDYSNSEHSNTTIGWDDYYDSGNWYNNSKFVNTNLTNVQFTYVSVTNSDFTGANLTNISIPQSEYEWTSDNFTNANLTNANFSNINLSSSIITGATTKGTNFSNVDLTTVKGYNGSANDFTNFDFTGANLTGAILTNSILTNAILTSADLSGATLTGANLKGANLSNVDFTKIKGNGGVVGDFSNYDFTGANLSGATLTGVNLKGATLKGANLSNINFTTIKGTNGTTGDFSGFDLTGVDLTGATLTSVNLTGANLSSTNLKNTNFTGATLTSANFTNAAMDNTMLTDAKMKGINFTNVNLTKTKGKNPTGGAYGNFAAYDFTGGNFTNAIMTSRYLRNANFTSATLTGANLTGADLLGTKFIGARWTDGTTICNSASVGSCTSYDYEADSSNLVSNYKLSGNTNDSGSNAKNGTAVGSIYGTTDRLSVSNSAYLFNGDGGYISVPAILSNSSTEASVEAWIYPTQASDMTIFYQGNQGELRLYFNNTIIGFSAKLSDTNWYTGKGTYNSGINKWIHIVGVWSKGNSLKIYINGSLAGTTTVPNNYLYNPDTQASIGTFNRSTTGTFKGSIDQVKVYNKALTAEQILSMYNTEK